MPRGEALRVEGDRAFFSCPYCEEPPSVAYNGYNGLSEIALLLVMQLHVLEHIADKIGVVRRGGEVI